MINKQNLHLIKRHPSPLSHSHTPNDTVPIRKKTSKKSPSPLIKTPPQNPSRKKTPPCAPSFFHWNKLPSPVSQRPIPMPLPHICQCTHPAISGRETSSAQPATTPITSSSNCTAVVFCRLSVEYCNCHLTLNSYWLLIPNQHVHRQQ